MLGTVVAVEDLSVSQTESVCSRGVCILLGRVQISNKDVSELSQLISNKCKSYDEHKTGSWVANNRSDFRWVVSPVLTGKVKVTVEKSWITKEVLCVKNGWGWGRHFRQREKLTQRAWVCYDWQQEEGPCSWGSQQDRRWGLKDKWYWLIYGREGVQNYFKVGWEVLESFKKGGTCYNLHFSNEDYFGCSAENGW